MTEAGVKFLKRRRQKSHLWYHKTSCPGKVKIRSVMNSTSDSSKWTTSPFELDKKEMSLRPICYKTKDAQY